MIDSRKKLKEYCLRKLGAPVIEINVANEQVEDRIDDALDKFFEFHGEATVKSYMSHIITEEDIASKSIPVDELMITITRVLPFDSGAIATVNLEYQAFLTDLINATRLRSAGGNLHSYAIMEQYLSTINQFFNREKTSAFNQYVGRLFIDMDWSKMKTGDLVIYEGYKQINPDDAERMWNDHWLKEYATALIKRQWGQNLSKYSGFQLPSGITLNGEAILTEAITEIGKLEQELQTIHQLPVDFFTG